MTLFPTYLGWGQRTLPQPKKVRPLLGKGQPAKYTAPPRVKCRSHAPIRIHISPRFALQPPLVADMRHNASQNHHLHACTPGPRTRWGSPFRPVYMRVNAPPKKPALQLRIEAIGRRYYPSRPPSCSMSVLERRQGTEMALFRRVPRPPRPVKTG
jgi:hypothetical protein